jgi:uncharacterized damage-inducible protein DinB
MRSNDVLLDAFGRVPELVEGAVSGLSAEQLRWAPAEGANTIGWLVWHLTRVHDNHVAEAIGVEEIYLAEGWAPRFGLKAGSTDTGYGHTPAQVKQVAPESAQVLIDYYSAVHARTVDYLGGLSDADLDRVVDDNWDPPVTLGVRLVSVYDDAAQHAGQAAYVRGLLP